MLVLSRKLNEEIVLLGGQVRIKIVDVDRRGKVRLGISAPREVTVDRAEIHDRRRQWTEPVPSPTPDPSAA